MKTLHSTDYHNSAKRKVREFQRTKLEEISPQHSGSLLTSQRNSRSFHTVPSLSVRADRATDLRSKSTQQLSEITRSLQQMSTEQPRYPLSPSPLEMGVNQSPVEHPTEYSVPFLNLPSASHSVSQSQQNALTVLAEEKMELLSQLRSEQTKVDRYEMELSQLKLQTESGEREWREAMAKKAEADINRTRLESSERDLTESKNHLEQNLISLRAQFELTQQEKLEFQARLEAAHHSLTSSQAECLSLTRQLEEAILVGSTYGAKGKGDKARKAAEEKLKLSIEENQMVKSQLGQITTSLEQAVKEKERCEVQIQELKQRMDENTAHARNQYSQLQEQCGLLKAETERRAREGEEHRKRVREKEQELYAVRAKLETVGVGREERRDTNKEKVHDKLVSLERERVRLTESLENTRVNLSKTEQDLFDAQEQLADQRSMTEALRQEKVRNSELAQETKELGEHLERIEVEKYDLQQEIDRMQTERGKLDEKLDKLKQESIIQTPERQKPKLSSLSRSLSDPSLTQKEEEDVLLERRANSPIAPPSHTLQSAFDSLQTRFVQVMRARAELEDKMQHKEKLLTLLEGETDTIGEYVSLYQSQRRALKIQYSQKQVLLQQLQVEKRSMQDDILRLRQLVQHLSQSKPIQGNSELPQAEINAVLEKYPEPAASATVDSLSPEETKEQIMQLLDSIDVYDPRAREHHGVPMLCPCCTGDLLIV